MCIVEKVLGNNGLLVRDEQKNELILFDSGIGFQRKAGDHVVIQKTTKIYELKKMSNHASQLAALNDVDPIFIEISNEILKIASTIFESVDTNILLPLADHIAFAIERIKTKMEISNPLEHDIRLLFSEEYEVALKGRDIIQKILNINVPDEEVAFITLHIHSAVSKNRLDDSIMITTIIRESIMQIERDYDITISQDSISFVRLMNHMKYLLLRIRKNETLSVDVSDFVKERFPYSYQTAKNITRELSSIFNHTLLENEISYLAIHIERIKTAELEKKWTHLADS